MYMYDIKLFAKNEKRTGNFNTGSKNVQPGHTNGIYQRKMGNACNEKWQTTSNEMELPNQDKIRTLAENETYN